MTFRALVYPSAAAFSALLITTASALADNMIITARKTAENINRVPVSVTAIDVEDIEAAGLQDINDIADLTPGIKFNSAFGRQGDRPVIRGISAINTRIEPIRVVDPLFRNQSHILKLCGELCTKLGIELEIGADDVAIRDEFFGADYGIPTPEGREAVEYFQAKEGVQLEDTYTGKTAAALLHDLRSGKLDGQTVLYRSSGRGDRVRR